VAVQCRARAQAKGRKLGAALDTPFGRRMRFELQQALSPEQIAGRLRLMNPNYPSQRVSHETIHSGAYMLPRGELRAMR